MTIRVGNTIIATVNKNTDSGSGGGLEVGDIGFAPLGIDETQNKRRYLNGQVISQSQFESFTSWVKERSALYPSLVTSEENWQAEVTNSKLGQCGKFVIDDELGTIRLPKVVNINGLQDLSLIGSIKAESLPNITATVTGDISQSSASGAIVNDSAYNGAMWQGATSVNRMRDWSFDASRSSSAYQDNAPVQQEAIQYPYFIQVATGVEETVDVTREIELNNPFSLLDYKWSEYELSNASWLLSNGTFYNGTTYLAVYELLLRIYNGTETKEGVSVKLSTEEYTDTDFIINTTDITFRLPTKVKLASSNAVIGNGIGIGITDGSSDCNITSSVDWNGSDAGGNALKPANNSFGADVGSSASKDSYSRWGNDKIIGLTTDLEKSGLVLANNDLYLYFYVGETIQDANIINASGVLTRMAELSNEYIVGLGMPDYNAKVAITFTVNQTWTAPCKCCVMGRCYGSGSSAIYGYINGSIPAGATAPMTNGQTHFSFNLDKDDTYTPNVVAGSQETYYIPFKGVN